MSKIFHHLLSKCFFCILLGAVSMSAAAYGAEDIPPATEISNDRLVTGSSGISSTYSLFDNNDRNGANTAPDAWITLESEESIGSLYIRFTQRSQPMHITDNTTGITVTAGEHLFLHDYLDLISLFGSAPVSTDCTAVLLGQILSAMTSLKMSCPMRR